MSSLNPIRPLPCLARLRLWAIPVFAALLLAGCERNVPRTDYLPLRDGNRWDYRLLDEALLKDLASGRAVETEPVRPPPVPAEGKAAQTVAVEDAAPATAAAAERRARRTVLSLKESLDELTFRASYEGREQVWSKRGGYVGLQDGRGRHYLLILPPHTGYRWVITGPAGENLYCEIERQTDLETPAGVFHWCTVARHESLDQREVTRYWFAPNVGLVRRSKFYLGHEVFRQELVAYDVRASTARQREAEDREVQDAINGRPRGSEYRMGKGGLLDR